MRLQGNIFYSLEDGTTEPLGDRIVETPEDNAQARLRNPRVGFIAYVPKGAVKRGEAMVTTGGNGKTIACTTCHGPDLLGVGSVPGIAGRSPSYLVRQLYDFQQGTRHGQLSSLMKPVVAHLTEDDMVNIVAYVSSRKP
jgi:cytochrome c553